MAPKKTESLQGCKAGPFCEPSALGTIVSSQNPAGPDVSSVIASCLLSNRVGSVHALLGLHAQAAKTGDVSPLAVVPQVRSLHV
ncbi:hypothetical protein VTK26DRAFT_951 [Humicola hyalothermophila]